MKFDFIDWIKGKPHLSPDERNKLKEVELLGLEKGCVGLGTQRTYPTKILLL